MIRHVFCLLLLPASVWACPERPAQSDRPADFVALADIEPEIVQEIRYTTSDNFLGRPVTGYEKAQCWLTRPAAKALARTHAELKQDGLGLKVFDCYRPQRAVDDFMRWAEGPRSPNAAIYYPNIPQSELIPQDYIARCSGHSRGSTVDLTIIYMDPPETANAQKAQGCEGPGPGEMDMGSGWDCFGPVSHTLNERVAESAHENRLRLKTVMEKHGFVNFAKEWWHYTLKDEPYPNTWFDFLPQ